MNIPFEKNRIQTKKNHNLAIKIFINYSVIAAASLLVHHSTWTWQLLVGPQKPVNTLVMKYDSLVPSQRTAQYRQCRHCKKFRHREMVKKIISCWILKALFKLQKIHIVSHLIHDYQDRITLSTSIMGVSQRDLFLGTLSIASLIIVSNCKLQFRFATAKQLKSSVLHHGLWISKASFKLQIIHIASLLILDCPNRITSSTSIKGVLQRHLFQGTITLTIVKY